MSIIWHRQRCFVDQLLGKQHPSGLGNRNRRSADMLTEQPPQLPPADAQPTGQTFYIITIEPAGFDQCQRARDRVGAAAPEREVRRHFRPAAQAGTEAGLLGCGRRSIERHVLEFRGARRTDRTAIDAGRFHAGEEPPVVAGVAGLDSAVTNFRGDVHAVIIREAARPSRGFRT